MSDGGPKDNQIQDHQEFIREMRLQEGLVRNLWNEGNTSYQGVQIEVGESARSQYDEKSFNPRGMLVLVALKRFSPILELFPSLKVKFQDKAIQTSYFDQNPIDTVPAFLYIERGRELYITSKATIATGVFCHELGHHIQTYFSREDNKAFLNSQGWQVAENDKARQATVDDLEDFIEAGDNGNDTWLTRKKWVLPQEGDHSNRRYRHSSPCEMVAEVVADHEDEIMDLIKFGGLNSSDHQRVVIDYLLGKLEVK